MPKGDIPFPTVYCTFFAHENKMDLVIHDVEIILCTWTKIRKIWSLPSVEERYESK